MPFMLSKLNLRTSFEQVGEGEQSGVVDVLRLRKRIVSSSFRSTIMKDAPERIFMLKTGPRAP
jgi:hypothetical protein